MENRQTKALLLSVKPEWCMVMAEGKKTLEVRKTVPKLSTPFKCYIYCTVPNGKYLHKCEQKWFVDREPFCDGTIYGGKVIGEFVCDNIEWVGIPYPAYQSELEERYIKQSCVSYDELHRYAGHNSLAFWRITKLKIYEEPKKLNKFKKYNRTCDYSDLGFFIPDCNDCKECNLTKAPQSWCYVLAPDCDK